MTCKRCAELEQQLAKLNADIEDMFFYAFATGYKISAEHVIEAASQKTTGAFESGLFRDLSNMQMKEYFTKHNPPQREKESK